MEDDAPGTKSARVGFILALLVSAVTSFGDGPALPGRTQPRRNAPGTGALTRGIANAPLTAATPQAPARPADNDSSEAAPFRVVLVTQSEREIGPELLGLMRRELELILGPVGVAATWVSLSDAEGTSFQDRLIVVRFTGDCRCSPAIPSHEGPLGHTHVTDGAILPFVELNCPKVAGFIWSDIRRRPTVAGFAMGRALARVLGHELYHVLAATAKHGQRGIAKPMLTSAELTRGDLLFDRVEATLIRRTATPRPAMPVVRAGP